MMGLVDDENWLLPSLTAESGNFAANLSKHGGAIAFDGQPELPGDGLVHVHDVARREADVQHAVQAGV